LHAGKTESLKKIFQISPDQISQNDKQNLAIIIGEKNFSFAAIRKETNTLAGLAYYTTEKLNEYELNSIYSSHPELRNEFQKVSIAYTHRQSILFPFSLKNSGDPEFFRSLFFGEAESVVQFTEPVSSWQLNQTYWIPVFLHEWVTTKFKTGKSTHMNSVMINKAFLQAESGYMYADFKKEEFTVLVTKNNQILLLQTYPYKTPEDVLYVLLKVCDQWMLSQLDVTVRLSGLIDKQSALFKELYQYFNHVSFREPDWLAPKNEYPMHFFTGLNDVLQCG
jgi:hypothetical protein